MCVSLHQGPPAARIRLSAGWCCDSVSPLLAAGQAVQFWGAHWNEGWITVGPVRVFYIYDGLLVYDWGFQRVQVNSRLYSHSWHYLLKVFNVFILKPHSLMRCSSTSCKCNKRTCVKLALQCVSKQLPSTHLAGIKQHYLPLGAVWMNISPIFTLFSSALVSTISSEKYAALWLLNARLC